MATCPLLEGIVRAAGKSRQSRGGLSRRPAEFASAGLRECGRIGSGMFVLDENVRECSPVEFKKSGSVCAEAITSKFSATGILKVSFGTGSYDYAVADQFV